MDFHEKTLELNITHELLNLADSWYWFLTDLPLWKYWRPRYKLPFFKYPKSTAGGFHITTEGKDDPTGQRGGGFDVRIKAGVGGHLLFIQFKKGSLELSSPNPSSIFQITPHDHYVFEINGTKTDQHFTLRNLASGAGGKAGNAVVYGLPIISDMADLERYAGRLLRKTKFISVPDIDVMASAQVPPVVFKKGERHCVRIGRDDMNRCEINESYFQYTGEDRTGAILADVVGIKSTAHLTHFVEYIKRNPNDDIRWNYIPQGLRFAYVEYLRYLLHYFEVKPHILPQSQYRDWLYDYGEEEYEGYENNERDVALVSSIYSSLKETVQVAVTELQSYEELRGMVVPKYSPKILMHINEGEEIVWNYDVHDEAILMEGVTAVMI